MYSGEDNTSNDHLPQIKKKKRELSNLVAVLGFAFV